MGRGPHAYLNSASYIYRLHSFLPYCNVVCRCLLYYYICTIFKTRSFLFKFVLIYTYILFIFLLIAHWDDALTHMHTFQQ